MEITTTKKNYKLTKTLIRTVKSVSTTEKLATTEDEALKLLEQDIERNTNGLVYTGCVSQSYDTVLDVKETILVEEAK